MARQKGDKSTISFLERMDMGQMEPDWRMPTEYPDLSKYDIIAVDLETRDPDLTTMGPGWATGNGYVIGIAVAAGDYKGYFPIRHEIGPNLDPKMTLKWLADVVNSPGILKIFHNAQYDMGWMRAEGIEVVGPVEDTMIMAALVDENRWSYSLTNLGRDYVDMRKDEKLLRAAAKDWGVNPKADMWRLPAKYVGTYAEQDAVLTLKLHEAMHIEIRKQQLENILRLENRLIRPVLDMRTMGVRVDLDNVEKARVVLEKQAANEKAFIKNKTGLDIEPWASTSVQAIFEELNLEYPYTEADKPVPSFTKPFLTAHPHEVVQAIAKLREVDKAKNTFIDAILRYAHNDHIHSEFHQLKHDDGGTITGRFSCSNMNLQQIPSRNPFVKRLIRGLFIPEEGAQWGSFDYAGQEPRMLIHYASIMPANMRHPMVEDIVIAYNKGEGADLHQMVADMAGVPRKTAKAINLGIMYGMGIPKLAATLAISVAEARELKANYVQKVPWIPAMAKATQERAAKYGKIRTICGRLGRWNTWEAAGFGFTKELPFDEAQIEYGPGIKRARTYKALNKLIQGSSADQTKMAMAECYEAGHSPMLQVHDELCFNITSEPDAAEIKEIMENCLILKVPSVIDQDLAVNWGEVS